MKTSARTICGLACMALLSVSLMCLVSPGYAGAPAPIKIGVLEDQTGPNASYGIVETSAFRMMAKEINDKGGIQGRPIELVVTDGQSDASRTATLTERMVSVDKVLALTGSTVTVQAAAMKTVASRRKTPFLSSGGAADSLWEPLDPWFFGILFKNKV